MISWRLYSKQSIAVEDANAAGKVDDGSRVARSVEEEASANQAGEGANEVLMEMKPAMFDVADRSRSLDPEKFDL